MLAKIVLDFQGLAQRRPPTIPG